MPAKKITVVVSQGQSHSPAKRRLEEEIAAALLMDPEVDVSLVPHLYDLDSEHTGTLFLRSIPGDMVVLSWLYPRAARWILDRQGIKGHEGTTLLQDEADDEFEEPEESAEPRGIGAAGVPDRRLYCIDLRVSQDPQAYLEEIRRIAAENAVQTVDLMQWIGGSPQKDQLQRYLHPERMLSGSNGQEAPPGGGGDARPAENGSAPAPSASDADLPEPARRRWYPVIDYSRCTNCMECIDFCLFGVYGVDGQDRILVEEQDNCKKGCPACSRICPENAIIFPGHKTPAIAGADGEVVGLKIDLSKLFGGPSKSALELAVEERDTELIRDGRDAVGMAVGIPKRQDGQPDRPRDDLDDLMDGLDALDL